ncbi:TPA: acetate kinase [Candidatus Delongbacteria bacterium]|nr:MAG: acetate kinase [Candidatus Delongbacteria bacterium GWF2_40_14]HAQ62520.1 acetate kinase [Candidatus Delongbacteria bacterium]
MKILVLNCGSSSIKYQLFDMVEKKCLVKGNVQKIGLLGTYIENENYKKVKIRFDKVISDYQKGIEEILSLITDPEYGAISDLNEIRAVGHRVVHGGEVFKDHTIIDNDVINMLENLSNLAPLHNPQNIRGIVSAQSVLPGVPQVAVFDTSFHQSMPSYSYMYPIPYAIYKKDKVRRYGFHGTSHYFVSQRAYEEFGIDKYNSKVITCHLGNGSSITAVLNGQSVDTSMGMTPVEGLMMGTRVGDLDAGALLYIMTAENLNLTEINNLINKQSGLLGISGISFDMREIHAAIKNGGDRAKLAYDMFIYRVRKYIGAYSAVMNGLDALIFTGGIGENDWDVRRDVCKGFDYLGLKFDEAKNDGLRAVQEQLSTPDSKVKVITIPTNEELVIADETYRLVSNG